MKKLLDFRRRHYDSDHTGKNGRFNAGQYEISDAVDDVTGLNTRGTSDTMYLMRVKPGGTAPARLVGHKSVSLDSLFFNRKSGIVSPNIGDFLNNNTARLTESHCFKANEDNVDLRFDPTTLGFTEGKLRYWECGCTVYEDPADVATTIIGD